MSVSEPKSVFGYDQLRRAKANRDQGEPHTHAYLSFLIYYTSWQWFCLALWNQNKRRQSMFFHKPTAKSLVWIHNIYINAFDFENPCGPFPLHCEVLNHLDFLAVLTLSAVNKNLHYLNHQIFDSEQKFVPDPQKLKDDILTLKKRKWFRLKTLLTNSLDHSQPE